VKFKASRKQMIIAAIVGASLFAALIGYLVAIGPQRSEAASLSAEIESTEQTIAEYRLANRDAQKPIKFAELFALTKAMPDEQDMPGVLLELSRVADDSGISINSVLPKELQPAQGYQRLPIEVIFEGNFYDLSDFLYRLRTLVSVREGALEANGRLFAIDSLQFLEGEDSFPQLQATLTLTAFVFDRTAASAPDGATAPADGTTPTTGTTNPTAVGAN
jgi:type IV pilus assembly protein PilO